MVQFHFLAKIMILYLIPEKITIYYYHLRVHSCSQISLALGGGPAVLSYPQEAFPPLTIIPGF